MSDATNQPDRFGEPLSPEEQAIERALDGPPEDRVSADEETLRLQAAIDGSLRRLFQAPDGPPDGLLQRLRDAEAREPAEVTPVERPAAPRTRLPSWAVAAVLLLGVGSWAFFARSMLFGPTGGYETRAVAMIYDDKVRSGFEPDWFCEDEKLFADTFAERQGAGVWLKPLPEGVRMAGLAYLGGFSSQTTSMLAWVDDRPVLLLVDKADRLKPSALKETGDLHVHVTRLGDLSVVEVSPLEEPSVAPFLYLRAPPGEPTGRVPGAAAD